MLDILINKSYLSKVICDKPRHCCQYGDKVCSGGHCSRGCEGRCIPESWILDGEKDCDDGLDEKGMCCFVYCKVFITTLVLNTSLPIRKVKPLLKSHLHKALKEVFQQKYLNLMHEFKSAILPELKNCQNGTFELVLEIKKIFWPKVFFWCIKKVTFKSLDVYSLCNE